MKSPQVWNNIDEAAAWLTQETGDEWTARRVLDRAIQQAERPTRYADGTHRAPAPTLLSAAPPRDAVINRRKILSPKPAKGEPCPIIARRPWQTLPLFAWQVAQLLACGETIVTGAANDELDEAGNPYLDCIEPPLTVTLAMAGIAGRNLPELARFDDAPAARPAATPKPGASAADELADLFDLVPVAALEKMFPAGGQWQRWAERASDNGLKAARPARAQFNPYRAGLWFLARGLPQWDQARIFRVLAKALPARSQDKAELFDL